MNGASPRTRHGRLAAACAISLLLSLGAAGAVAAGDERRVVVNGKALAGE